MKYLVRSIILVVILLFQSAELWAYSSPYSGECSIKVYDLKVENGTNPYIDILDSLHFSWKLVSIENNQIQHAYRILVGADINNLREDKGDVWDSQKIISSKNHLVEYNGPKLNPGTRYFWKICIWDKNDVKSDWSTPGYFESCLINKDGWGQAKWIYASDEYLSHLQNFPATKIPVGKWMWTTMPSSRNYFRKDFNINSSKKIINVLLQIQCDNKFDVFVNGNYIQAPSVKDDSYSRLLNITGNVIHGINKLGIRAYGSNSPFWFISALRAGIKIEYTDGTFDNILSDQTWGAKVQSTYYANAENRNWEIGEVGPSPGILTDIHPRYIRQSLYMRKDFTLKGAVESARAYVSAKGLYEFHVNGKKVGNALLTPGISGNFNYYQVYDITNKIIQGENIFGCITGNGWYNEAGWHEWFTRKNEFIAKIIIKMGNGEVIEINTNDDWKLTASPILDNGLQGGERYDATLEIPNWDNSPFNDSSWTNSVSDNSWDKPPLVQPYENVEVSLEPLPLQITELAKGVYLYDFGQNTTGRCRLQLKNTHKGQIVIVRYGERLREDGLIDNGVYADIMWPIDNEFDSSNAPFTARNIDIYVCKGDVSEIYEPRFTFTGYRYIQISGINDVPDKSTVINRVFYTKLKKTGEFISSDSTLNKIWDAALLSYKSNIIYGPMDCPTREKNYWSGDMACFIPTACLLMDNSRMLSSWTTYGPKIGLAFPPGPPSSGWDDEIYITSWNLFKYYGITKPIFENYLKVKALVDWRIKQDFDEPLPGQYNADHAQPDGVPDLPKDFDDAAFYYHSLQIMCNMAKLTNNNDDLTYYSKKVPEVKKHFNEIFLDKKNYQYSIGLQANQLLPLAFNLVDSSDYSGVIDYLVKDILNNKYYPGHLTTGFITTPFLLPELTKAGQLELAWKLVMNYSYPSWENMLSQNMTTMTEQWNGVNTNKYNSLNHYAYGVIVQWYFEYLAGIQPDEEYPGYKHIFIKPYFPKKLDSIEVSIESDYGTVKNTWKKEKNKIIMNIVIPVNTTATVLIPQIDDGNVYINGVKSSSLKNVKFEGIVDNRSSFRVHSGKYCFEFPNN